MNPTTIRFIITILGIDTEQTGIYTNIESERPVLYFKQRQEYI